MSDKLIITIGRECGSGGRHIGQKLAEEWVLNATTRSFLPWQAEKERTLQRTV